MIKRGNTAIVAIAVVSCLLGAVATLVPTVHGQAEPATEVGRYQASIAMRGDRFGGSVLILDTTTGEARVWTSTETEEGTIIDSAVFSYQHAEASRR